MENHAGICNNPTAGKHIVARFHASFSRHCGFTINHSPAIKYFLKAQQVMFYPPQVTQYGLQSYFHLQAFDDLFISVSHVAKGNSHLRIHAFAQTCFEF